MTGSGTSSDPFTIVTVVSLGTSGLRITETDSYVVGEESYRTDVTVTNLSETPKTATLYRAGDCFLQNSDLGFGSADPSTGAVSCVAGVDDGNGNIVPGPRIEQWFPLSAGSHYLEDDFDSVWSAIGAQTPFTDSCAECANYVDNGAGLSWDLTPAGRWLRDPFAPHGLLPARPGAVVNDEDRRFRHGSGRRHRRVHDHDPQPERPSRPARRHHGHASRRLQLPDRLHDRRHHR